MGALRQGAALGPLGSVTAAVYGEDLVDAL
jgi:hypothetical protein